MTRKTETCIALFLIIFLITCSRDEVRPSHSFRIFTENGITIAESTGGPKYEGELFEYVEVLRLNQDDSIVESLLGRPSPFFMDEGGGFYVPDTRPLRVVCYDSAGEFSHTFGREGEGPGEFRWLEITRFDDDVLTLFDSRTRRATRFNTDGTLINTLITDFQKTGTARQYPLQGLYEDEDGTQFSFWGSGDRDDEYQYHGESVTALDADGNMLFSIETPMIKTGFNFTSGPMQGGGSLPFAGSPIIRQLSDGRFIRTTGETSEIGLFSNRGDLVGRITIELPRESTAAALQEMKAYYLNRAQNADSEMSRISSQAMFGSLKVPEYKAFWSDVIIDDSGFFWLKPSAQFYAVTNEVFDWLVLSPEGEFLGRTRLMAGEVNICHGHLLTIQGNEETGAQDLIVYKIRPLARGLRYP